MNPLARMLKRQLAATRKRNVELREVARLQNAALVEVYRFEAGAKARTLKVLDSAIFAAAYPITKNIGG